MGLKTDICSNGQYSIFILCESLELQTCEYNIFKLKWGPNVKLVNVRNSQVKKAT